MNKNQCREFCLVAVFKIPVNGYQARVPFRWSWKEDWKTSMFLMPLSQSDKPLYTQPGELLNIDQFIILQR
jgi:hypothetical protein